MVCTLDDPIINNKSKIKIIHPHPTVQNSAASPFSIVLSGPRRSGHQQHGNHQGKDVAHRPDATPLSAKWGVEAL